MPETPPADSAGRLPRPDRTVIVGTGVAGATAALTLRAEGYPGEVVLIGSEPEAPYRRPPLSKEVLRGTMIGERIKLKPAETWADRDIDLRTGTTVTELDPVGAAVVLADGTRIGYRNLVLATGSRPRGLPQAAGMSGVHYLRTLQSATALAASLAGQGPVLVIGGGLVGLEIASSARAAGCPVTVLEAEDRIMGRILPAWLAEPLAGLHRDRGVEVHTGVAVERLEPEARGHTVLAADGRGWTADTVVGAIGTVPDSGLAAAAGLLVDNGVTVDEYGRTSASGVYAAGDVANRPDVVHGGRHRGEHWNEAMEQGAAVAKTIAGNLTAYPVLPWSWSDQHGVNIQVCGRPDLGTEHEVRGDPQAYDASVIFSRDGRVVGVVAMNRPAEFRALRQLAVAGSAGSAGSGG